MSESDIIKAKNRADTFIEKVEALMVMEDKILAAREIGHQRANISKNLDTEKHRDLENLERQVKTSTEELCRITDELCWEEPFFTTYVLPRLIRIMQQHKHFTLMEQQDIEMFLNTIADNENSGAIGQLESEIITRLADNLKKMFLW